MSGYKELKPWNCRMFAKTRELGYESFLLHLLRSALQMCCCWGLFGCVNLISSQFSAGVCIFALDKN